MTDHNDIANNESIKPELNQGKGPFTKLSEDPDFIQFNECYQKGEWDQSESLLLQLVDRYPDNIQLEKNLQDLKMQRSLREMTLKHDQENHDRTVKRRMRTSVIVSGVVALAIIVFMITVLLVYNFASKKITEQNNNQLGIMAGQADQIILSGQPEKAQLVITQMQDLNPEFSALSELQTRTNDLLALEVMYKQALELENNAKYQESLTILNQIQETQPGLWDVPVRIQIINNEIMVQGYYEQASAAYEAGDWNQVIENYEAALKIKPEFQDPIKKEQLLNGYLRSIIALLENNSVSIDEITKAENYYRKAVAMIPQNTAFASERENLQEVSSNLLQLKFSQLAKQMLEDPQQTLNTVGQAVSYLSKASNLSPNNSEIKNDLTNAQLYQIGFQNFVQLNWNPAIENLSRLVDADPKFANGNAAILLYDAYISKGNQNYSVGLYLDARINYEQAEILAWEDTKNPMKLFQVEYLLGNTIGKVGDYSNAITYYQFALKPEYIYRQLSNKNDFYTQLPISEDVTALMNPEETYRKYFDAFANVQQLYSSQKMEINDGQCLSFFAEMNKSTVYAIQTANNLSKNVTVTFGQELIVPTLGN
ncbi:tetratricopeptide repeat protein [bacterium]|nr:tetratricopeptide repeat protein [bacterium]